MGKQRVFCEVGNDFKKNVDEYYDSKPWFWIVVEHGSVF
jgi:hypothetical protein